MEKIFFRLLDAIILYCFYIIIAFTPFLFSAFNSELFETPKMYLVYVLAIIVLAAWLAKSILAGRFIFGKTSIDIYLLLFLASQAISTISSIDFPTSIFGYYSRLNAGLLSLVSYAILYWAFVSNIDSSKVRKMKVLLLFCAVLISIYAILEHFGASISCLIIKKEFNTACWLQNVQERVFATLGQPNWLAAYLVAVLPVAWAFAFLRDKRKLLVLLIAITLMLSALFFTKSRSGLLGFGVAFVIFWCLYLIKLKRYLLTAVLLSTALIAGFFFIGRVFFDCLDLNPRTLSSEESGTESCKIRAIVWKGAVKIWLAHPFVGTGPETFAYSYYQFRPQEHNLTSEWQLLYNKAHNEYLNYLANTGILGLTSYILLIFAFAKNLLPSNMSFSSLGIFAGWTSILVTNFFGFSTVTTSILFFLYPAITAVEGRKQELEVKELTIEKRKAFMLFLVFVFAGYLLFLTFRMFHADILYANASHWLNLNPKKAVKLLEQAIQENPWQPLYYNELSNAFSILGDGTLAKIYSDYALSISPYNFTFWYLRAVNFERLSSDPKYLDMAIASLEHLTKLAPTEPKVHYNLGVLYSRVGEKEKALKLIKQALELKPDYEDAKEALEKLKQGL